MNTCIINNIQTMSQDRLTFFTGTKMKITLTLDFFWIISVRGIK